MNSRLILLGIFTLLSIRSLSCGLCSFYDISWLEPTSYFGIFHRYSVKNGYSQSGDPHRFFFQSTDAAISQRISHQLPSNLQVDETRKDYSTSSLFELRGSLNLGKKVDITFYFPYESTTLYYERILESSGIGTIRDTTIEYSGWGEFSTRIKYLFTINRHHSIKPTLGLKIKKNKTDVNQQQTFQVDHTILPGAGIPDLILGFDYHFSKKSSWLRLQALRGWCRVNNENYKYGDQWLIGLDYSYQLTFKKIELSPYIGSFWEYQAADREYGEVLPETGGNTLLVNLGVGFTVKKVHFDVLYQQPLTDSLIGSQMGLSGRIQSGISLLF